MRFDRYTANQRARTSHYGSVPSRGRWKPWTLRPERSVRPSLIHVGVKTPCTLFARIKPAPFGWERLRVYTALNPRQCGFGITTGRTVAERGRGAKRFAASKLTMMEHCGSAPGVQACSTTTGITTRFVLMFTIHL